ncbi:RagB/SusD family nutrient uptake outer membrane protein [Chitinophaga sp. GCM10012297]|uniref:RagB/SusD family nutrient uptake outer membrane protein n=1 Tax=Chitinophaga chungangae TaxID=2821488 RepID=A0ABS3YFV6_9BACT|nr:RagB/SusD family nutrient uptake outer membrane protein [Chitinophaga chungangae]MBO9152994.1 RagB/SusD family nutrient uptake outer membrane protein [Chitinophaga chungangae]
MKKIHSIILLACATILGSCGEGFLEKTPQGELIQDQIETPAGVEGMLTGAYGLVNGNVNGTWGNYSSAPSQWLFGEVGADDAHKGSNNGDQPNMNQVELHDVSTTNDNTEIMWNRYYEGVARCNNTLRLLKAVQAGTSKLSDARAKEVEAEARFLRAHYYFFLRRVFVNIPYIDENVSSEDAMKVTNEEEVYPMIQADLEFAVANLPPTWDAANIGRASKVAAQAYLGKVLLYQKKYGEALPLFTTVIGARPSIETIPFENNFDVTKENGPETIFASQHAINPDGGGDNANVGDMLGGFYGTAPVSCCGFYQPSFDLVNSYRVAANGLPMLDGSYRTNPYKSDFGLTGNAKAQYAVDTTIAFDPRLDYTVGRRGVPYRDWGVMPGDAWIRDPAYAGPFVGVKHMVDGAVRGTETVAGAPYITSLNVNIIRLADVYLMAAECYVEQNNLGAALNLVNKIRLRAAKLPPKMVGNSRAAKYNVQQYGSFANQDQARTAVRFERRLELALEGHRFYDLVRWGIAKQTIESYSAFEGSLLSAFLNIHFEPKDEYFPIPQQQIDRSQGALKQND